MKILVVPTIRENSAKEFIEAWKDEADWDHIIFVEDNPNNTFKINQNESCSHCSWADIDKDFGGNSWIISRRDSAIRSYGFWKAHKMGADYIFTLDDDCRPLEKGFCEKHINNIENTPRWESSILGERLRGIPYFNLGSQKNIAFNMGLWQGVPDYDSVRSLSEGIPTDFKPPTHNRIIPHGSYFPFCGMNFSFKREMTPLTYFPLMGVNSPFSRFDDIWFGIIAKKICDHLGLLISVGGPAILHERASNVLNNLVKEAPGIKENETFWEAIDEIELESDTPLICMKEVSKWLCWKHFEDTYLGKLGMAMQLWCEFFE